MHVDNMSYLESRHTLTIPKTDLFFYDGGTNIEKVSLICRSMPCITVQWFQTLQFITNYRTNALLTLKWSMLNTVSKWADIYEQVGVTLPSKHSMIQAHPWHYFSGIQIYKQIRGNPKFSRLYAHIGMQVAIF